MLVNTLNTVFYNVQKEEYRLDFARTSSEKAVSFQVSGKGFLQISRLNKLKRETAAQVPFCDVVSIHTF